MYKKIILSLIFVSAQVFGQGPLDAAYKDGLSAAQSNMQKSVDSIKSLNPTEEFKDQKGKTYYTENPPQTSHYQEVTKSDVPTLDNSGRNEIDKNEATKEVWLSFGKPKIKLDPSSVDKEWLSKSNDIIKNAADITVGASGKPGEIVRNGASAGVNCKEAKICRIELIKKTCNEEANPLKKVCYKTPKITTKDVIYPNCQSLIITQHYNAHCPAGYREMFLADMVQTFDDHWDDIRFCTRTLANSEGSECFSGGYYITSNRDNRDSGRVIVPKKLHARIRISNVYFNNLNGTIINETTGQTLYNNAHFNNGQVIELPYSDTQDQIFRFYPEQPQGHGRGFRFRSTGVMVLYIDHMYKEANLESWSEVNCNES